MAKLTDERSSDPAAAHMLARADRHDIETAWARTKAMQQVCGFGELGLCCRLCLNGPCRIDPFGEGPQKGICGISPDAIVARNFCRMIIGGAASHGDHGVHVLEPMLAIAAGESIPYRVRSPEKLKDTVRRFGRPTDGRSEAELVAEICSLVQAEYSRGQGESTWLLQTLPAERVAKLRNLLGKLPSGIDSILRKTMARTTMGMDADTLNLLRGAIECSLVDFLSMDIASTMSDILLGTPAVLASAANLGVLDKDAVNIAVHGHNPLVAESLLDVVAEYDEAARSTGASRGINIVGICCTGNESLMRRGVQLATNSASQELAVLTGALDGLVVDVQCIFPSLAELCECYHTEFISTAETAKFPGARHLEFSPKGAHDNARQIIELAISAYQKRDPKKKIDIPDIKREALVGFGVEAIVSALSRLNADNPWQPLIDKIASGEIFGIALFAGCNNYKLSQDIGFITLAKKLCAENVLCLATGCGAGAFAKAGFMQPGALEGICGEGLAATLAALGDAVGLGRPLPPVWHMGSCVDNSRAVHVAIALANKLGVDLDQLPLVASAPELMHEKALAIGTWALALGITTHVGVVPPVMGGKVVTRLLTETIQDLLGARLIVETDLDEAFNQLLDTLRDKRLRLLGHAVPAGTSGVAN